ncbi:MAG: acetolactate synthase 2 catalytic subunit [Caulobacteraceae bacterium]|nr:acetolactate synthase 2 catalytic subunit [Caulobacteraceae bacterium]
MNAQSAHVRVEPAQRLSGAGLMVRALERLGVTTVFGYPGGAIMPLYDALAGSGIRHILVRHEQAAAFAADAWGRTTGEVGVCIATSGPGATNLITGLANAMMDSAPMVAITGQVGTAVMGTDAFQEVDILGMTLPVVKHSYVVRDPADIPRVMVEAFEIAAMGRPGPVLIDLPKDVASALTDDGYFPAPDRPVAPELDAGAVEAAEREIQAAERPVLYVGGGVGLAGATRALRAFAERTGIPAIATLKGLGALPTGHPQHLGMLGMHGARAANEAVHDADLLIVCGARFDDRATGRLDTFAPGARVIHIDADPAEIGKLRAAQVAVTGDLGATLDRLGRTAPAIGSWIARTQAAKAAHAAHYDAPGDDVYAPALLKAISEAAGDRFVAACDVGQHQMWAAQHCRFSRPRAHLTSAGLGAMGYGLPAGIAAKLARPGDEVVVITGDGSIMMNIQELATARRYGVAVKILLLDNSRLGLVRQWQELFYDRNYSEIDLSDNPDFVKVAEAFGVEAFRISLREEVGPGIERLLAAEGPCLAHVMIDPEHNVWPLVPPGKGNIEMMHHSFKRM